MEAYIPDEVLLSTQTDRPEKVFISYAHVEAEIVNRIFHGLKARGHDVWYDQQNIKHGDDWREKIARGIESSNGVLSFLSREAVKKDGVCLDELAIAVGVKYGNIHTVLLEKEEEVRPPSQLTHRQWLDMSDWQDMLRQGETVFQPWFDSKLADIIRVVESDESREFVGQISSIREKLHIGDLAVSRQHWYLAQKYVGRAWLTQDIEAWLDDPKGGRLCTVYGGPGVGKSAFAAQYAYRSPRVAASIFFEHGNEHFNTAGALIRELIFQLACRIPLYRNRVYGIVMTDDQIKTWNDQELFAHLIKAPLADFQINGGHETLCIVVDGLDECTRDEHNGAAELLGKYVKEFPAWLRVLVLSRHENSVTGWLDPDHQIDMLGGETRNLADIRQYFAETLEKQLAAQPHADALLDELTGHTEGVFLYAYVVSRMILDGKLDMADTQAYPKGLNSAFREWFRRYFPDTFAYKRLYRLYLGMIAASPEPIPVEELEAIDVRYDPDEDCYELNTDKSGTRRRGTRQDRLRSITSLLQYRTNQFGKRTVAFTHRYIAQWLTQTDDETNDSPAGCYSCNPQDALWAMECSWRQKLKSGDGLTEYEALHLIEFMRQVEKDQETLKTAKSEALEKALQGFSEQYKEKYQYAAVLQFRICHSENRAFIRNCTGDKDDERAYLVSLNDLASAYYTLGCYSKALALDEQIYELCKKTLGKKHPDTLTPMNNLASIYLELGRYAEALMLQEKVCELREQILGSKDPLTLISQDNLALIYRALGRLDEAVLLQEKVCELFKLVLGESHPDTLTAMDNLAITYQALDRPKEALLLQEKVCEVFKMILGERHPDVLTAMNNLAITYQTLDRPKEALTLAEKVTELRKQILGREHLCTLSSMNNLASVYCRLGHLNEALVLEEKVCALRKQILGEEHPDTMESMVFLALLYGRHDQYDREAFPLIQSVYNVQCRIFGKDHRKTKKTYEVLLFLKQHSQRQRKKKNLRRS